jgi:hypothetical protein
LKWRIKLSAFPIDSGMVKMTLKVQTTNNGKKIYVVDGLSLDDPQKEVKYALKKSDLETYVRRRQLSMLAQFYTLVADGLIVARHCFNGLRRDLFCDGQQEGHLKKYALVRKPAYDYEWEGGSNGRPVRRAAPSDSVFVVLISKNGHEGTFPDIEGWIDRWSWVAEDTGGRLEEAPIGWVDRYERKVWTR